MDMKILVEKITRDVLETLKEKETAGSHGSASSPAATTAGGQDKRAFLIVDRDYHTEELKAFPRGELSVLRSAAVRPPDLSGIRESLSFEEIERRGLSEIGILYYPVVRAYQLSALAALMDDHQSVHIILEALSCGVEVVVIDAIKRSGKPWEKKLAALCSDVVALGVKCESPLNGTTTSPREAHQCAGEKDECQGCGQCATLVPHKVEAVVEAGAQRISHAPGGKAYNKELAAMIDHTLLKPDATQDEVMKLCNEARQYVFASVCINPGFVKLAAECLKGSPVKVCTVIGFPLGATTSVTKAMETRDAIANGAEEIDMVINVGALKAGNYGLVQKDIEAVVEAASGKIVKVIIEAALLSDEEKVMACKLSKQAGADFVKTSTGFGPGGATAHDIELMRQTVGKYMGVKASGGIRDFETAQKMIKAGATRVGASASVAIVKGEKSDSKY
jgi:deoxyribose-phosphate aldolase